MERLYTNACTKNQGYVLDTLSYDIDSIKRIFLDGPEGTFIELLKDSESNGSVSEQQEGGSIKASTKKVSIVSSVDDIIDAEDVENEISEENSQKNISIKEEIRPDIFIYLKWDESILKGEENCTCKEYKDKFPGYPDNSSSCSTSTCTLFGNRSSSMISLDEDPCRPFPDTQDLDQLVLNQSIKKAVETHERRRLEGFLETEYEDRSLYTFMLDHGVVPFEIVIDWESSVDSIYNLIKGKLGPRNEYLISDLKREEERWAYEEIKCRAKERKEAKIRNEIEAKRLAREKQLEEQFERVKALKRREMEQIEACSLPLRNYLMKNIVPKLTEGLVEVARVRPQDPIDYLAEYLFRNNTEGHMFDPCLSDKMAKKILEERLVEMGTDEGCSSYCQCLYEKLDSCDETN